MGKEKQPSLHSLSTLDLVLLSDGITLDHTSVQYNHIALIYSVNKNLPGLIWPNCTRVKKFLNYVDPNYLLGPRSRGSLIITHVF